MTQSPDTMDEEEFRELLARARSGSREALDTLFGVFFPTVERLVHTKLARDHRVYRPWLHARFSTGDVVQDVFSDLLQDLDSFRGETPRAFCGYLTMVVKNRIIDAVRHHEAARRDGRRTAGRQSRFDRAGASTNPAEAAARSEQQARFERALDRFGQTEQLLLRGRLEDGVSFHELAQQLGYSSPSAAKRAFYLAQARIVLLIQDESDADGRE